MRNVLYSLGIASFLVCMIFTVATSISNPFYGMSEAALGQATTYTTTSGSTGTNGEGTITYEFNGNIYIVKYPNQVTVTKTTRNPSNSFGGSIGGNYYGIGAEGTITRNMGYEEKTVSATYKNPTICNPGGDKSCSKSSKGQTLFKVYY